MEKKKDDIALGRFLSLVLRHNPAAAGITLDQHGWADVENLLTGIRKTGRQIDRNRLERIVDENDKKRYSFNENHTKIRANQGHSLHVDVELECVIPPDVLYHGTAIRFLDSIMKDGIVRRSRQYVHLSDKRATAVDVGSRHGKPVVIQVAAAGMAADGYSFWRSENGVWLCEEVPVQYLSVEM